MVTCTVIAKVFVLIRTSFQLRNTGNVMVIYISEFLNFPMIFMHEIPSLTYFLLFLCINFLALRRFLIPPAASVVKYWKEITGNSKLMVLFDVRWSYYLQAIIVGIHRSQDNCGEVELSPESTYDSHQAGCRHLNKLFNNVIYDLPDLRPVG